MDSIKSTKIKDHKTVFLSINKKFDFKQIYSITLTSFQDSQLGARGHCFQT